MRPHNTTPARHASLDAIPEPVAYGLPGTCARCASRVWLFNAGWSDHEQTFAGHGILGVNECGPRCVNTQGREDARPSQEVKRPMGQSMHSDRRPASTGAR